MGHGLVDHRRAVGGRRCKNNTTKKQQTQHETRASANRPEIRCMVDVEVCEEELLEDGRPLTPLVSGTVPTLLDSSAGLCHDLVSSSFEALSRSVKF